MARWLSREASPVDGGRRDPLGIPLHDGSAELRAAEADPRPHLGDALYAAGDALARRQPDELRLRGFLIVDPDTARLYVDRPGEEVVALDIALRYDGVVTPGLIGLFAALPLLVPDELEWHPSEAVDPYSPRVYDLTDW